jgi:hypothetical protein
VKRRVADIYVCGSERFEPDRGDNDWAVGPDWWPETRYASSSVLASIYQIAYRQGVAAAEQRKCLGIDAEYPLCLGYGTFAVRELLLRVEPSLILGKSDSLGIAVGFDSGDFVLLGELTGNGLGPVDFKATLPEAQVESLVERLCSSDSDNVILAVLGLQRFGERARMAVPKLLRIATTSEEIALRQAVVLTLAAVAPDDRQARAVILQALNDGSPFVRRAALQALISFNELAEHDLARIRDMENDSDEDVARWSEIALRNIRLRDKATEPIDPHELG